MRERKPGWKEVLEMFIAVPHPRGRAVPVMMISTRAAIAAGLAGTAIVGRSRCPSSYRAPAALL